MSLELHDELKTAFRRRAPEDWELDAAYFEEDELFDWRDPEEGCR